MGERKETKQHPLGLHWSENTLQVLCASLPTWVTRWSTTTFTFGLGFARRISFSFWTWIFHQIFLQAELAHCSQYKNLQEAGHAYCVANFIPLPASLTWLLTTQTHTTQRSLKEIEQKFLKCLYNRFMDGCTQAACHRPRHVRYIHSALCLTLLLHHSPTSGLFPGNQQTRRFRKQNFFQQTPHFCLLPTLPWK